MSAKDPNENYLRVKSGKGVLVDMNKVERIPPMDPTSGNCIKQCMELNMPVPLVDSGMLQFQCVEDKKDVLCKTIPLTRYWGELKPLFVDFQKQLDGLFETIGQQSTDEQLRNDIYKMRLPRPDKMPETWRVYQNGNVCRLVILRGFIKKGEQENNVSFLPDSEVLPEAERSEGRRQNILDFIPIIESTWKRHLRKLWKGVCIATKVLIPLLFIAAVLLGIGWLLTQPDSIKWEREIASNGTVTGRFQLEKATANPMEQPNVPVIWYVDGERKSEPVERDAVWSCELSEGEHSVTASYDGAWWRKVRACEFTIHSDHELTYCMNVEDGKMTGVFNVAKKEGASRTAKLPEKVQWKRNEEEFSPEQAGSETWKTDLQKGQQTVRATFSDELGKVTLAKEVDIPAVPEMETILSDEYGVMRLTAAPKNLDNAKVTIGGTPMNDEGEAGWTYKPTEGNHTLVAKANTKDCPITLTKQVTVGKPGEYEIDCKMAAHNDDLTGTFSLSGTDASGAENVQWTLGDRAGSGTNWQDVPLDQGENLDAKVEFQKGGMRVLRKEPVSVPTLPAYEIHENRSQKDGKTTGRFNVVVADNPIDAPVRWSMKGQSQDGNEWELPEGESTIQANFTENGIPVTLDGSVKVLGPDDPGYKDYAIQWCRTIHNGETDAEFWLDPKPEVKENSKVTWEQNGNGAVDFTPDSRYTLGLDKGQKCKISAEFTDSEGVGRSPERDVENTFYDIKVGSDESAKTFKVEPAPSSKITWSVNEAPAGTTAGNETLKRTDLEPRKYTLMAQFKDKDDSSVKVIREFDLASLVSYRLEKAVTFANDGTVKGTFTITPEPKNAKVSWTCNGKALSSKETQVTTELKKGENTITAKFLGDQELKATVDVDPDPVDPPEGDTGSGEGTESGGSDPVKVGDRTYEIKYTVKNNDGDRSADFTLDVKNDPSVTALPGNTNVTWFKKGEDPDTRKLNKPWNHAWETGTYTATLTDLEGVQVTVEKEITLADFNEAKYDIQWKKRIEKTPSSTVVQGAFWLSPKAGEAVKWTLNGAPTMQLGNEEKFVSLRVGTNTVTAEFANQQLTKTVKVTNADTSVPYQIAQEVSEEDGKLSGTFEVPNLPAGVRPDWTLKGGKTGKGCPWTSPLKPADETITAEFEAGGTEYSLTANVDGIGDKDSGTGGGGSTSGTGKYQITWSKTIEDGIVKAQFKVNGLPFGTKVNWSANKGVNIGNDGVCHGLPFGDYRITAKFEAEGMSKSKSKDISNKKYEMAPTFNTDLENRFEAVFVIPGLPEATAVTWMSNGVPEKDNPYKGNEECTFDIPKAVKAVKAEFNDGDCDVTILNHYKAYGINDRPGTSKKQLTFQVEPELDEEKMVTWFIGGEQKGQAAGDKPWVYSQFYSDKCDVSAEFMEKSGKIKVLKTIQPNTVGIEGIVAENPNFNANGNKVDSVEFRVIPGLKPDMPVEWFIDGWNDKQNRTGREKFLCKDLPTNVIHVVHAIYTNENGEKIELITPFRFTKKFGVERNPELRVMVDDVEYVFQWCPSGKFQMGGGNHKLHKVTLTNGFWMLRTEVTQEMWQKVMGYNPSRCQGSELPSYVSSNKVLPVENVSWKQCDQFCKALWPKLAAKLAGEKNVLDVATWPNQSKWELSLPTEAQWEYACRAGTQTEFCFGDDVNKLCEYGNYCDKNAKSSKHGRMDDHFSDVAPVRSYKANGWGLYDMHGNVGEWCFDWEKSFTAKEEIDPKGGDKSTSRRVIRGGNYDYMAEHNASWWREFRSPDAAGKTFGFRIVIQKK